METRRTILIVDDTPMFREIESLFLARSGRVLTAASAREALEIARRERPSLVLADAYMPGMGGEDLCRAIRADPMLARTPVLILSSSPEADERARALRAGADDLLPKPISRVALIEAVNRFVRHAGVRGLPRAPFRGRVHVDDGHTDWWAHARNLSRGGIFVEAGKELGARKELSLEFELPDNRVRLHPTAEVVWTQRSEEGQTEGLGLRFLALDQHSARLIEDWVHERASRPATRIVR